MNIDSRLRTIPAESQAMCLHSDLQAIVRGLAEHPDIALARVWLIGPGDVCPSCPMRNVCPDLTRCLHLEASAGNPLIEAGSAEAVPEDWTRIDGHFQRIPLNALLKPGHISTMGAPVHIRIDEGGGEHAGIARPAWVKSQKIRDIACQPVMFHGEVFGMLAVFSRTELSGREFGFLRGIADHAAAAASAAQLTEPVEALNTSVAAMAGRWRAVFEKSAIGVALTDLNSRFLAVNRAYEKLLGYTEEELRNLSFLDITPEEFRDSNRVLATELWSGDRERYELEKPYRHKDGSLVWVRLHASIVPGTASMPRFAMALCEDITERKQAEESLRKSYEEITTLKGRLEKENIYLQEEIRGEHSFEDIVGNSIALLEVARAVAQVAPTDSTVLIQGETGTGKELIARAIHNLSPRKGQAFVRVNCAAIPLGLLESELFGHEKGAFTGAISQRIGRFELAHKGTLFLDEIGDIPLELQPKLLRVLQEQEFERLGSTRMLRVDVRLVAATNAGLARMIAERKFRADLYYRLNIFPIEVPPLRDRRDDIPVLVRHFVDKYARRMGKAIESIPNEAMEALCRYSWPGNIRELQNLMERAVLLSGGPSLRVPLTEILLSLDLNTTTGANILEQTEREQILQALRKCNWVVGGPRGAAARLGLKRTSLAYKMQRHGISRSSE